MVDKIKQEFCWMRVKLAMLVFAVAPMVICCIYANSLAGGKVTLIISYCLTFFAGILAIIAFFIEDPKIDYFLALIPLIINGISLVTIVVLRFFAIIMLETLLPAYFLPMLLVEVTIFALFEYVLWLGYKNAKEQRYKLPMTGGGVVFASAPAPVMVRVDAPPSSDTPNNCAAPAAHQVQMPSGEAPVQVSVSNGKTHGNE